MRKEQIFKAWACGALLSACQSSIASEPYQDYQKRIESAQNLTALKADLFGDAINLYNGQTSFSNVDIDLPGNNSLPVRLERRFNVELSYTGVVSNFNASLEGAGGWTVEAPYITGMFQSSGGWEPQRCSVNMVPMVNVAFRLTEVWQGNVVHIPGESDRPLLRLESTTPRPNDGVSRLWTSRERDAVDCIPMQSGLTGEGFRVTTTSGVRYYFDVATSRIAGLLKKTLGEVSSASISRSRIYLLASKVEDRFGNTVQYQYDANGHPVRIWSSDGREITLSYDGQHLSTATANGRVWSYGYGSVEGQMRLTSVTLPDSRRWNYAYSSALSAQFQPWDGNSNSNCSEQPPEVTAAFNLTITHPSSAVGDFSFNNRRHYRSGVHASECLQRVQSSTYYYELDTPNFFDVMSLGRKSITGPGLPPPLTWSYTYSGGYQALWGSRVSPAIYPCTTCPTEKEVQVTNPDNSKIKYRYGFLYALNEGRLLGSSVLSASSSIVRSTSSIFMTTAEVAGQPFAPRYGLIFHGDDPSTAQVRPVVNTVTNQDGAAFQASSQSFDSLARPTQIARSGPSGSRTDVTEYHDNTVRWLLAQVAKTTNTNTGLVEIQTSYDGNAMPLQSFAFGKLQQTLTYNSDGTVATVKDGNNNVTTLASWKRGIPQSIAYADSRSRSANVNDNGWIMQVIDENGYTTNYTYDAMGRLGSIAYPTGDSTAWNTTTQSFEPISATEYGIAAGHWRQTVSTGNARKLTYFDAMWRPLLTREYDVGNEAGTQRFQRFNYDYDGRVTFASYFGTSDALTTGNRNVFDALGRPTAATQDSELGVLSTTTEYLAGFMTRTTNLRGQQTTTSYMAWDQPTTDYPVAVAQPEGVYTDIARDVFGKTTAITQRNAGGSVSIARSYVYDAYQQLCKSIEPETASTVMAYDNAGNLSWSASGQPLPSVGSCDTGSVATSQKVSRGYDARNRLITLGLPDGNGSQSWAYTADGLPETITTWNEGGSSTVSNGYTYNKRRLLTGESQSQTAEQAVWSIGYGYNANAHLANLVYPANLTVDYTPNALGQPTQAGSFATGVQYYPNGAMKQFTYGNGRVHTMTQNARQLPARSTDSGGVLDLAYTYDGNGNATSITDHTTAARQTRSMVYDGRDRLTGGASPLYPGGASYTYDALDNITRATLVGRDYYYQYGTANRLASVTEGASGPVALTMKYDERGNLRERDGQLYGFDLGNRLRTAQGTETYRYDAKGLRVRTSSTAGLLYELYSSGGKLLWQRDELRGLRFQHIYLAGSLIASRRLPIGQTAFTTTYRHTDALGSSIAATDESGGVVQTTEHEPYGRMLNRTNDNRPGYTGHIMDGATGLVYMQQRYYDPKIGRFLSVDPVTAYSNPVGAFNRYWYANNNPYRFTDPDGRYVCTASKAQCAFVKKAAQDFRKSFRYSIDRNFAGRSRVYAVANTLGKEGVDNGVVVAAGPVDMKPAGTAVTSSGVTTLTINFSGLEAAAASGDYPEGSTYQQMVSATVFHEGYHGFQQRMRSSSGMPAMLHGRAGLRNDEIFAYRAEASFFKGLGVASPWLLFTPQRGVDEWQINAQAEDSVRQSCAQGECSP